MYLSLQTFLDLQASSEQAPSIPDLFEAALTSAQAVPDVLPDIASDTPALKHLQQVHRAVPIFIDLNRADAPLAVEEVERMVLTIRTHWHRHGFGLARSTDPLRWSRAAFKYAQPLLYWQGIGRSSLGWNLLGCQLHATELQVFQLLANEGPRTIEEVARNPSIFSQRPKWSDPRVQRDIVMGRIPQGPLLYNRSEARRLLSRMHQKRLVTIQSAAYAVVRPTQENMREACVRTLVSQATTNFLVLSTPC